MSQLFHSPKTLSMIILILSILHIASVHSNLLTNSTEQQFTPSNLYLSSSLILTLNTPSALNNVTMRYDCAEDFTLESCELNPWNPPLQYSARPSYWSLYVQPYSCLGLAGPIGPLGPLSTIGPLGANHSLASYLSGFRNASCDWCEQMAEYIELKWAGVYNYSAAVVLGPSGPLGYTGPLSQYQIYNVMYHLLEVPFLANDFAVNLDWTGVWGVLGPLGPLGALGPLGPLGPLMQRSIYTTKDPTTLKYDGQYRDPISNQVVRNLTMQYDYKQTKRVYELYEFYTSQTAQDLGLENDCSFALQHSLGSVNQKITYQFHSYRNQSISVVLIPNFALNGTADIEFNESEPDNFVFSRFANQSVSNYYFSVSKKATSSSSKFTSLFVCDSLNSTKIYPADEFNKYSGLINFAFFRGHEGEDFEVTIYASQIEKENNLFRLYVTGSGFLQSSPDHPSLMLDIDMFNHWNIMGPHQAFY